MATPFNPLSVKLEAYQRQRAIADQLVKQGTTPLQSTTSGTGNHPIVVGPSKFQAFAQIAQALGGQYLQGKADDKYSELAKAMQSGQAEAIKALGDSKDSGATAAAANSATQYGVDPQVVNALVTSKLKRDKIDTGNAVKITDDSGNVINEIAKAATPGEVLSNQSTLRGQDITSRGQDLTNTAAIRGQDLSAKTATRGQDIGAETSRRGQDLTSQAEAAKITAAAGKPPTITGEERTAAYLSTRLENAINDLSAIEKKSPGASSPGFSEKAAGGMFGETGANALRSGDRQRANASQLDALDAALTLATGAAYTKEQIEGQRASYFPQLYDDESTKASKADRLSALLTAARLKAGRAAGSIDAAVQAGKSQITPDMAAAAKAELARRGLK